MIELKTKLCTEGVIEKSLEERDREDVKFSPTMKVFVK